MDFSASFLKNIYSLYPTFRQMRKFRKNKRVLRIPVLKRQFKFSSSILIGLGLHVGSPKRDWCDGSEKYLVGYRQGFSIFNLAQTSFYLRRASKFIERAVSIYGRGFFYGFSKEAGEEDKILRLSNLGQVVSTAVWHGGFATNTKRFGKFVLNSNKRFGFLVCFKYDITNYPAMREALRLKLPLVCPVDSNSNPDYVVYPVPGNSSGTSNVVYFGQLFSSSVFSGFAHRISSFIKKGKVWSKRVSTFNLVEPFVSLVRGKRRRLRSRGRRSFRRKRIIRKKFQFWRLQRALKRISGKIYLLLKRRQWISKRARKHRRRRVPKRLRRFYRGPFSVFNRWKAKSRAFRKNRRYVKSRNKLIYRRRLDLQRLYRYNYRKRIKKKIPKSLFWGRSRVRLSYIFHLRQRWLKRLKPAKFLPGRIRSRISHLFSGSRSGQISQVTKLRLTLLAHKLKRLVVSSALKHAPFHIRKRTAIRRRLRRELFKLEAALLTRSSRNSQKKKYLRLAYFSRSTKSIRRIWVGRRWFHKNIPDSVTLPTTISRLPQRIYIGFKKYLILYPSVRFGRRLKLNRKDRPIFPVQFKTFLKLTSQLIGNRKTIKNKRLKEKYKLIRRAFLKNFTNLVKFIRSRRMVRFTRFFHGLHFITKVPRSSVRVAALMHFAKRLIRHQYKNSRHLVNFKAYLSKRRFAYLRFRRLLLKRRRASRRRNPKRMKKRVRGWVRRKKPVSRRMIIRQYLRFVKKVLTRKRYSHVFRTLGRYTDDVTPVRPSETFFFRKSTGLKKRRFNSRLFRSRFSAAFITRRSKFLKRWNRLFRRSRSAEFRLFRMLPNRSLRRLAWGRMGKFAASRYYAFTQSRPTLNNIRFRVLSNWWRHILTSLPKKVWVTYKFPRRWTKLYVPSYLWRKFKRAQRPKFFKRSRLPKVKLLARKNRRRIFKRSGLKAIPKKAKVVRVGRFKLSRLKRRRRWLNKNSGWVRKAANFNSWRHFSRKKLSFFQRFQLLRLPFYQRVYRSVLTWNGMARRRPLRLRKPIARLRDNIDRLRRPFPVNYWRAIPTEPIARRYFVPIPLLPRVRLLRFYFKESRLPKGAKYRPQWIVKKPDSD